MKKVWFILLAFLFYYPVFGQQTGYNISILLQGYKDNIAYLGNYFGDKMAIADTAKAEAGSMLFTGEEPLRQGVYFLVTEDKKKVFEFIIGSDQYFIIEKSMDDPPQKMLIEGSKENSVFYKYLEYNRMSYEQVKKLHALIQSFPPGHDSIPIIREQIEKINEESIAYKLNIIENHPGSMLALLFNVMREPEVPEFLLPDGRHDSVSAYLYYRNHYWEYVDLADDRLLRTPVFHKKLERYISKVVPRHPDSLINEIDKMMASTTEGSEMQNYLLWYFTNTYETSQVMGYDKIFVHMVDKYFTEQSYEWLHPEVQQNMIERADRLRNVLIGSYAPALVMADTAEKFISLHQLEAEYIVVFFWSSTCGECKEEVEILDELYNTSGYDMKIYGVNTDTAFSKWADFISDHNLDWVNVNGNLSLTGDYHQLYDIYSTPVIYLLDDQKTIIAKRLSADKLPALIERHGKEQEIKMD